MVLLLCIVLPWRPSETPICLCRVASELGRPAATLCREASRGRWPLHDNKDAKRRLGLRAASRATWPPHRQHPDPSTQSQQGAFANECTSSHLLAVHWKYVLKPSPTRNQSLRARKRNHDMLVRTSANSHFHNRRVAAQKLRARDARGWSIRCLYNMPLR